MELAILAHDQAGDLLYAHCDRAPRLVHTLHSGRDALASLAATVRASAADRIVWASAQRGGHPDAHRVLDGRPARWWPTGHASALRPSGPLHAALAEHDPCADSLHEMPSASRSRLPLWDGPFVLAFAEVAGGGLARIVAAFAEVAAERDELELVILADPHADMTRLAQQHDVLPRVHCVGRAPREAEACWLQTAACTIVDDASDLSGGLLLRAMASGHPLLVAEDRGALTTWMQAERLHATPAGATLAERLATALRADAGTAAAIARATALASRHEAAALRERATRVLRAFEKTDRAAA